MSRNLRGRVIVITGGSAGIGAAMGMACARAGMTVVLGSRREDRLGEVQRRCQRAAEGHGGSAEVAVCDVRRGPDVQRLIEGAWERHGRLDAVFANAGYGLFATVERTSEQQMRDIFETNFYGTLRVIWAALPLMRRQGYGHVLICSSAVSEIGIPMYGAYAATKAAQDAVASAMRAELAAEHIAVSSVHPIGTQTDFFGTARQISADDGHGFHTAGPLLHSPEKVARAVLRCLRRPRPEVWPCRSARIGVAITTALPGVGAWSMRRLHRRNLAKASSAGQSGDKQG